MGLYVNVFKSVVNMSILLDSIKILFYMYLLGCYYISTTTCAFRFQRFTYSNLRFVEIGSQYINESVRRKHIFNKKANNIETRNCLETFRCADNTKLFVSSNVITDFKK